MGSLASLIISVSRTREEKDYLAEHFSESEMGTQFTAIGIVKYG